MGAAGPVSPWGSGVVSVIREPLTPALGIPVATAQLVEVAMPMGRSPGLSPNAFWQVTVVRNAEPARPACVRLPFDGWVPGAVGPVACVGAPGFPNR